MEETQIIVSEQENDAIEITYETLKGSCKGALTV
jgi:hypothetical protein